MLHEITLVNPQVFVDDNNPAIIYGGSWEASKNLNTDIGALTDDPGSLNTPFYGTLHTASGATGEIREHSFQFIFTGTYVSTTFVGSLDGNFDTNLPCTIDGVVGETSSFNQQVSCSANTLSPTEHNLMFSVDDTPGSISFDWLSYIPTNAPDASSTDLLYYTNGTLKEAGDTWKITFDGTSIGLYVQTQFASTGPSSTSLLSYIIDQDPPVNFTMVNPSQNAQLDLQFQLLIQTPPLSGGPHVISISLVKVADAFTSINGDYVIVQNSAQSQNLEVIPNISGASKESSGTTALSRPTITVSNPEESTLPEPLTQSMTQSGQNIIISTSSPSFPGSSTTSSTTGTSFSGMNGTTSSSFSSVSSIASPGISHLPLPPSASAIHTLHTDHRISKGVIAAVSVSAVITILMGLCIWRRFTQRRITTDEDHVWSALPFSAMTPEQRGRFRLAQYMTAEKTNKYREAFGMSSPDPQRTEPARAADGQQIEEVHQPAQARYRVHEDGGEIADVFREEENDEEDTISLPPIYATIGVPQARSGIPDATHLDSKLPN